METLPSAIMADGATRATAQPILPLDANGNLIDNGSARNHVGITPHATNPISPIPKALYFNASGWVTLRAVDATSDIALYVVAGQILDIRVQYARLSGTSLTTPAGAPGTPSQIIGLF